MPGFHFPPNARKGSDYKFNPLNIQISFPVINESLSRAFVPRRLKMGWKNLGTEWIDWVPNEKDISQIPD